MVIIHVRLKALILIRNIPGRRDALLHPFSTCNRLLNGCINPVLSLAKLPASTYDKEGLKKVWKILYPAFQQGIPVLLTIKNKEDESGTENQIAHSAFLQAAAQPWVGFSSR